MKRVKFLQKLLRQIENLQERMEGGERLDEAQLQKVGRLDEVVAEIEELLDVNLSSSEGEDDDAEEDDEDSEREEEEEDDDDE